MARVHNSQAAVRVRMDGQGCHKTSEARRPTLLISLRPAATSIARTAGSRDGLMFDDFRDVASPELCEPSCGAACGPSLVS